MLKILFFLLLVSCSFGIGNNKILVPKPNINQIIPQFKKINGNIRCDIEEDCRSFVYNIKMLRIYFNQQTNNLELVQEYYSKNIIELGGVENLDVKK